MDLKELCGQYDVADSEVETQKRILDEAIRKRSDIVKSIAGVLAPKKKFIKGGKEITIVVRGETYFFRGSKQDSGLVEVP